ncbi:DNA/RNA non-specific endonuclease [Marinibactrum halimedae]|uniref:Type VII secretion system protein EssD-like domain-containing protein n=1 Tax=Marinibactrum halimedae TaxID=1444977 RepID=A0AA37T6K9_9GAMM|nr:DNA/RNA non-specific endonuclease [Marinibactrum halimedae]MCD9460320.1 DNA/RNA non-specific endonuclease [Marinibactrum halimedae]GLS26754.1 hypothetical protein GCM10007877_24730 [Marinibactrum halimedae]
MKLIQYSILLAFSLATSLSFASESTEVAKPNSDQKKALIFSGLTMAIPEDYALNTLYGCDSFKIYTANLPSIDTGIPSHAKAVCNTETGESDVHFNVNSVTGIHYITTSTLETATSYSETAETQHFSDVFFKKDVYTQEDALDEAGFILAQLSERLAQEAQFNSNDWLNAAVTASVSRDSRVGIEFRGNFFGRVRETGGTITSRDIGSGSSCTNLSREFTRSFGSGDCGHIIARNLGGSGLVTSPSRTQIFPQDPSTNRGPYNRWEQRIAAYVDDNCTVRANIRFYYSGNSLRPRSVSYRIYRRSNSQFCRNEFLDEFGQTNFVTMSFQN